MAATSVGAIALDFGLNTAPISTQIRGAAAGAQTQLNGAFKGVSTQASKTAGGIGAKFASLFGKLGGMMATAFALGRIKAAAQEWMAYYRTQNEAEIKIAVTMRNATNATMEQIQAVKDLASEYQQLGILGDEVQLAGMQELATYVKEVESVKKLMPVLNDMVTQQYGYDATGGAAVSLATMIGKVMTGSTTALQRYGYDFTDEQANIIKYGTEAERVATVTDVIEESVRNMNEALAQTPTGKMKQLSNNFGDMKEALGNVTANICMPFVSVLNVIVVKLTQAFNALARFTAAILRIKSFSFLGLGKSADSVSESIDGVAKSAGGASKAMKSLMGFDQINRLDSADGGGGGGEDDDEDEGLTSFEEEAALDRLTVKVKVLKALFAQGFKIGFAFADLKAIQAHTASVRQSLGDIFASEEVRAASEKYSRSVIQNLGTVTGAAGSVGATAAENLIGGLDGMLRRRKNDIRGSIADTLNAQAETWQIGGELATAFAQAFSAFKSEGGKTITASVLSVFTDARLTLQNLGAKTGRDFLKALSKPLRDNSRSIKRELEKMLAPLGDIFEVLSDGFHQICEGAKIGYDSFVKPALDALGSRLSRVWREHLQPMSSEISGFLRRLADLFKAAWEKAQPLIAVGQAGLRLLGQLFAPLTQIFGDQIISGLEGLADAIGAIFGALSGLLDFLTGVFTGDWNKAWDGLKKTAGSLWDYIKARFRVDTVVNYFQGIWNRLKNTFSSMGTSIGSSMASAIKGAINSVIGQVQSRINSGIGLINSALKIVGGKKLSGLSLPRLAQGGYVRANTPQLAMIGDNRRYGEIVAPENKMTEMILTALQLFRQQENGGKKPQNAQEQLIELVVNIGDETLIRQIIKLLREENRRSNQFAFDL